MSWNPVPWVNAMRAKIFKFIRIGFSAVLVWLLIRRVSWTDLLSAIAEANLVWFLFAIGAGVGQIVISAWRWQRLLAVLGSPVIPLPKLVYYYFLGFYFNNFAPANLAGDLARVGVLIQDGNSGKIASASVLFERIINLLGLGIVGLWALVFDLIPVDLNLERKDFFAGALALLIILILLFPIARKLLYRYVITTNLRFLSHRIVSQNAMELAKIFIGTMTLHFVIMLVTFFNTKALLIDVPLTNQFAVYAISGLAVALPISVQGIGIRESIYSFLFQAYGVSVSQVLAALALNYVILFLFSLPGGLYFMVGAAPNPSRTG